MPEPTDALDELRRLKSDLDSQERLLDGAVSRARQDGFSWRAIGEALTVTTQAAWERWASVAPQPNVNSASTAQLIEAVANAFDSTVAELLERSTSPDRVLARDACMYVLRQKAALTYSKIGQAMGGRDHTLAVRGVARAAALVKAGQLPQIDKVLNTGGEEGSASGRRGHTRPGRRA